ncbi:hypothetical protein [Bacillus sp. OV166]|nr:hypothetical protein [Bacillus sp. OV166]
MQKKEKPFSRNGGKISSGWMFPKVLQILREAPDVFDATDIFMEA